MPHRHDASGSKMMEGSEHDRVIPLFIRAVIFVQVARRLSDSISGFWGTKIRSSKGKRDEGGMQRSLV